MVPGAVIPWRSLGAGTESPGCLARGWQIISLSPVPLPAGTWGAECSQGTGGSKGIFLGGEQQDVQKLQELFRACVEITSPSAFQPKAGGLCP